MQSRSSMRRKRVASIVRSIGRDTMNCPHEWRDTSRHSSPLTFSPALRRACKLSAEGDRKVDAEHWIRVIQAHLDMTSERVSTSPRWFAGPLHHDPEPEMVARCVYHAEQLGLALGDLLSWLDQARERHPTGIGHKRGTERIDPLLPPGNPR
jgi:hypothetical protein